MTAKDNITLPREVVEFVLKHLEWWSDDEPQEKEAIEALAALDAALAAPDAKREPVAWMVTTTDERHFIFRMVKPVVSEGETLTPLFTHPPAALAEPEQGNCADGSCNCCWTDKPDAKREPATDEQITLKYRLGNYEDSFRDGWREAEWFHGIRKEDGK